MAFRVLPALTALLCLTSPAYGDNSFRVVTGLGQSTKIPATQALFGAPKFGGSISAQLYYDPDHDHDGCAPYPKISVTGPFVMMADRGSCSFVQKVRDAQMAGAAASVVVNNIAGSGMMLDDGTGSDITIPSVFITKEDGQTLKDMIVQKKAQGQVVMVQLTWTMPHPDDRVEWDLWSSAADPRAEGFKREFGHVSKALGVHAQFTPRYMIIDGHIFGCHLPDRRCGNQCTNQGRYCHEDPEGDMDSGISGVHVVQENLRQMCIWDQANETVADHQKWWKYQVLFSTHCSEYNENATNNEYFSVTNFNKDCSERQQIAAGLDPETTE